MDRRAAFFLGAAVVCAALIPVTDSDLQWVPTWMAVAYAVLAILSYLDYRSRRRSEPEQDLGAGDPP